MSQPSRSAGNGGRPVVDIDRISTALGHTIRVAYAGRHVYPMGAPNFHTRPRAEREHPWPRGCLIPCSQFWMVFIGKPSKSAKAF